MRNDEPMHILTAHGETVCPFGPVLGTAQLAGLTSLRPIETATVADQDVTPPTLRQPHSTSCTAPAGSNPATNSATNSPRTWPTTPSTPPRTGLSAPNSPPAAPN